MFNMKHSSRTTTPFIIISLYNIYRYQIVLMNETICLLPWLILCSSCLSKRMTMMSLVRVKPVFSGILSWLSSTGVMDGENSARFGTQIVLTWLDSGFKIITKLVFLFPIRASDPIRDSGLNYSTCSFVMTRASDSTRSGIESALSADLAGL